MEATVQHSISVHGISFKLGLSLTDEHGGCIVCIVAELRVTEGHSEQNNWV